MHGFVEAFKFIGRDGQIPGHSRTLNAGTALLTIPAIQKMNAAVALDKQSPAAVAHAFLVANHLA
jgi:glycine betaine/choline ABC-type transport system substrate-binding protein